MRLREKVSGLPNKMKKKVSLKSKKKKTQKKRQKSQPPRAQLPHSLLKPHRLSNRQENLPQMVRSQRKLSRDISNKAQAKSHPQMSSVLKNCSSSKQDIQESKFVEKIMNCTNVLKPSNLLKIPLLECLNRLATCNSNC